MISWDNKYLACHQWGMPEVKRAQTDEGLADYPSAQGEKDIGRRTECCNAICKPITQEPKKKKCITECMSKNQEVIVYNGGGLPA